jgi:hypothetical protein
MLCSTPPSSIPVVCIVSSYHAEISVDNSPARQILYSFCHLQADVFQLGSFKALCTPIQIPWCCIFEASNWGTIIECNSDPLLGCTCATKRMLQLQQSSACGSTSNCY